MPQDRSRTRSRGRDKSRDRDRQGERQHRNRDRNREGRVYEKLRKKGGERECWEVHNIALTRVPGYGFGIAVSGGRDNPHFANGDPSIAISDVLKAGPAEGKLRINDRVISANGISLENVDYATAVQVLRECGATVNLVIKRRVVLPLSVNEPQTLKITLTKNKKKEDYGIVLGCWIYIKEITNRTLREKDATVQEGDIITKINNNSTEGLSLKEAKKLVENSKEKLHLVVRREPTKTQEVQQPWLNTRNTLETNASLNKDLTSPSSFVDVSTTRNHWSNQNVYVQSPTRGDYRSHLDRIEDKNNLSRPQGNWNNPLNEVSSSHLDNVNHLTLNAPSQSHAEDVHAPPRPPLPQLDGTPSRHDFYNDHTSFRRSDSPPDPRFISFKKDGSVGIRLTGGNEVGIFVTGVQHGSSAYLQGLQPGDKILKVNDIDMRGFTKEEAVELLLGIQDQVNLIVQYRKNEYEDAISSQKGDSFYIRTHFNHESTGKGELNFKKGEIFHVVDTLYNGNHGSWLVYRLGRNGQEIQRGIIPNAVRARELAHALQSSSKKDNDNESRGSFFRRRARRSKSLCKDHWEDVILADSVTRFPAYERVVLKQPGFIRPVVLFGPLTDIVKDRLLKDYPECYASPQSDNQAEEEQSNIKSPGIIRLSAIRDVIDKGKHAILDITPSAVDRLNYAQFYPIVIFMHAENKHVIKELRNKWAKSSYKSSRKLYEHAVKLEKLWSHVFTATISLTTGDSWYKKLQETIDRQQKQPLWVSEAKPDEAITDDFLFSMTSRLSYASSPESDLDLSADTHSSLLKESMEQNDRRLVKSSSDPSITAAEELADIKSPSQYPSYSLGRNGQLLYPYYIFRRETAIPVQTVLEHNDLLTAHAKVMPVDDQVYNKQYSESEDCNRLNINQRTRIDPYATLTPSERISNQINGELKDNFQPMARYNNSQPPPTVDRSSKPQFNNYPEGQQNFQNVNFDVAHDYINTMGTFNSIDPSQNHPAAFMNSVYNGENYKFSSGSALHRSSIDLSAGFEAEDLKSSSTFTGLQQSMTLDRARLHKMSSKPRQDTRPPPPPPPPPMKPPAGIRPKLLDGRPVPPPKPSQYHGKQWQLTDDIRSLESEAIKNNNYSHNTVPYHSRSYPTSPLKPPPPPKRKDPSYYKQLNQHHYHENSFDSGRSALSGKPLISHSCSQDNVTTSRNYSNVHFGDSPNKTQHISTSSQHSPPFPPPPDFSSHEGHGSAFELYRKNDSQNNNNPSQSKEENQKKYIVDSPNATHNVVATAQGVFGCEGGTLTSKETGVTIIIPPGAIPEGEEHEIYFKVCQDTNMLPPLDTDRGETLLSPLVMCGPHGLKFNIPVELRLPHCASITPDSWSFALKSSDTKSGEPAEWQNVSLDNRDGVTSSRVEKDYVSVLIDHF